VVDPREPANRRAAAAVMDPEPGMAVVATMAVATTVVVVRTTIASVRWRSCETVGCRGRRAASTVVAHSSRAERSSACVDTSNVDERIATG
jgi:hypothetical protein